MAEARIAPGVLDLSDYITTGILAAHTAKTTAVHGIADTARLVTIDNIGTYAPTPDLTALVPRDGSRSMTGLLTAEAGVSIRDRYDPLTFGSGAANPATILRSNGGLDIALPGVGDTLYVTADNVNYVDHAANYPLFQVSSTGSKFYTGSQYVPTIESGGTNAPYGVLVRSVHNGQPPLRVRGATGQTGTLQEWQDSTGAVKAQLTSGGDFQAFGGNGILATYQVKSNTDSIIANILGARTEIGGVGPGSEPGIKLGSAQDTRLYRSAAGVLKTDGYLIAPIYAPTTTDTTLLEVATTGRRVRTGNSGADIYASDLNVSGNLDFTARYGNATQVKMGSVGSGLPGVAFGTGTDATMYRSAGSTIGVGGLLYVQQGSADEVRIGSGGKVQQYSGLASALRMELGSIGPAGESGLGIGGTDARLYRNGPAAFQIDGSGVPTKPNLTVKAVASQAQHIQQWQNSAGTPVANIKPDGSMFMTNKITFDSDAGDYHHIGVNNAFGTPGYQYLELSGVNGIKLVGPNVLMGPITADATAVTPTIDTNYTFGVGSLRGGRFRAKQNTTVVGQLVFAGTSDDYAAGTYLDLLGDLSVRAGVGGTKVMGLTAAGDFSLPVAGKGVTLKSPDGLTTRTLSIDNTGTLVVN